MTTKAAGSAMLLAIVASSVSAQSYEQQYKRCLEGNSSQERIAACGAVISANGEPADRMAEVYLTRGIDQRRLGQNDAALRDYGQAIRLNPASSDAFNSRCYLFGITGRLQEAIKDCNEALRLDARNQYAYDSRAFAYLKLGMLDAAIADYNAALAIEPDRPYSIAGRGFANRRKGDVAGGDADIANARAKVPGIAEEFARYGVK